MSFAITLKLLSHFKFTLKTKILEKWSLLLDLWIRYIFFLIYWFFTGYRRWPWLTNCWTEDKKIGEYCPWQYKNWPMAMVSPLNYGCTWKVAKHETLLWLFECSATSQVHARGHADISSSKRLYSGKGANHASLANHEPTLLCHWHYSIKLEFRQTHWKPADVHCVMRHFVTWSQPMLIIKSAYVKETGSRH